MLRKIIFKANFVVEVPIPTIRQEWKVVVDSSFWFQNICIFKIKKITISKSKIHKARKLIESVFQASVLSLSKLLHFLSLRWKTFTYLFRSLRLGSFDLER